MPITEKATIRSICTFSKDRKHKFLLTLEKEEKKPKAVVIMTSPAESNCIVIDLISNRGVGLFLCKKLERGESNALG